MLGCLQKTICILYGGTRLLIRLGSLVVVLGMFFLSGCRNTAPPIQTYANGTLGGVRVEYPGNWELQPDERLDNVIVLESKRGIFEKGSARVEIIWGGQITTTTINLEDSLVKDIDRIRTLYSLDSVTIVQSANTSQMEGFQVATVTISIPTIAIPKDSHRNQMERREHGVLQIIEIYYIRNEVGDRSVSAYIYKGDDEELNTQAEDIVNSIIAFVNPNQP